MHKVLITGITGFLGSHIAEGLVSKGIKVIGLKRSESDTWRCKEFSASIEWIDMDKDGEYKKSLIASSFDTLIHGAWIGVEADQRNNWEQQSKNITFLIQLLDLAKAAGAKKIMFLGSQAEYGYINGKVSEDHVTTALNAYAATKLACLEIMKTFCLINDMNWVWLRIFSIFGEKEGAGWLIPSLIRLMSTEKEMDLTKGEQKYAYLYVKDFVKIMEQLLILNVESGIYNVSSIRAKTIRSLIEDIRNKVKPDFQLNFGALPYRDNQSMQVEGNIEKLYSQIGKIHFTDFNVALQNTLNFYIKTTL